MKTALTLLFFFVSAAEAGPRVNNGGGGWVCRGAGSDKAAWLEILDLTGKEVAESADNEWIQYQAKLDLIAKKAPKLHKILSENPLELRERVVMLEHPIEIIADGAIAIKPAPESCPQGDVEYVQIADFLTTGELVVDEAVWSLPVFSATRKAALLLHERIYYAFRRHFGDETSWRTQNVVAPIFNTSFTEDDFSYYLFDNLSDGGPNVVALFPVHLSCQATIMTMGSSTKTLASKNWSNLKYGDEVSTTMRDLKFEVKTSGADGSPVYLEIKDNHSGATTIMQGPNLQTAFLRNQLTSATLENPRAGWRAYLECWNPL